MDLLQSMADRRSVRAYTEEPIPEEALDRILKAGLISPTSHNSKPWEFIVIRDRETLNAMAKCRVGSAKMLEGANAAIVVLADQEKTNVWIEDCSIAMAYMHLMADSLGVGSCWIQGRGRDAENGQTTEDYLRGLLSFPENYRLGAILSLGMPKAHPAGHDLSTLLTDRIHQEKF